MTWRDRLRAGLPLLPVMGGADGTIAIDEGVADKLVDTEQITVGANTVQRERIRVSGVLAAELAAVLNADPASTVYGVIVRDVRGSATGTPTFTDPIDRALRDLGKVDIAAFDSALPAGANNIGDVDVLTLPALVAGTANIGDVDVASFVAGAITEVQGDVVHDAAAAGNPVLIGARANLNEPAAVADADVTTLWADLLGRLVVLGGHPNPELPVTINGSAAGVVVKAAPGVGVSLYINRCLIMNRAAAENVVSLRDGAAGTIVFTGNFAADGGGAVVDFGDRGWKLTANTALVADIGAASADVNVLEHYMAA